MNGVIYCRVSSKEQVEGTSLESQQIACEEYATVKKIRVLRTFIEQGESAKFADRTELLSLLDFCKGNKGKVDVLLVWKVDRFARNVADHFNIKATLQKYGVRIVSVTEPIDTNPEGRLMETILAGFAQFDNDIRAARTVQGMRRKIQEGIFPWKPPLGYKRAGGGREKKNRPDEPDQPVFALLVKAWQEFATGGYTKAEMRRRMETWGIVSRRGQPLSDQFVDKMFRNPYYAGTLVDPWSGEEHQGRHLPMVSREEFARVQQMARRSAMVPHHKWRPEFPLRGLVRCRECGQYLTASFSRGRSKRYPYYHCHCETCSLRSKGLRAADVHKEFVEYVPLIAPKPAHMLKLGEAAVLIATQRDQSSRSRRSMRNETLNRVNQEIRELVRMRSQRLISDEEFKETRRALITRREAIEAGPRPSRFTPADIQTAISEITAPLEALLETWKSLLPPIRARFQRLIFPVGFTAGNIRTAELGLLFKVIGGFRGGGSTEVTPSIKTWDQIYEELQELQAVLRGDPEPDEPIRRRVRKWKRW